MTGMHQGHKCHRRPPSLALPSPALKRGTFYFALTQEIRENQGEFSTVVKALELIENYVRLGQAEGPAT